MSLFGALPAAVVDGALDRLRRDLADGTWRRRYGHLLERDTIDAGYRIVVGPRPARGSPSHRRNPTGQPDLEPRPA
jgi:hypothetical protein